ncbi:MAG: C40 family peptidase [Candidatus Nanopelagicales bacterium]
MRTRSSDSAADPSLRTSLRSGQPRETSLRSGRVMSAGFAGLAIVVAAALIWPLASASPSSASAQAVHVASADRLAGSKVGLHPRVRAADAKAMTKRDARLVKAQRTALVASMRAEVVRVARKQIGDPYRAGWAGPHAFDCGGLTQFVFRQALGMEIGRSSRIQYQGVERIPRKQARPGDLVFFFENGTHHVGIYIGGNKMIDAPNAGERVRVSPITGSWWGRNYTGMGRVLPA